MDYEKVQKWLNRVPQKDAYRPLFQRAYYLVEEGVTVAVDNHRTHVVRGAFAPPPAEDQETDMEALRNVLADLRTKWLSDSTAEGVWYTDGEGLAVAAEALKFAAKAIPSQIATIQLLMEPNRLTIAPDVGVEPRFQIDFPGRVEATEPGAIEVNAKYLADALSGMAESRRQTVALRLKMPPVGKPALSALCICREDEGLEAYIMPIRSRAYDLRVQAAQNEQVKAS